MNYTVIGTLSTRFAELDARGLAPLAGTLVRQPPHYAAPVGKARRRLDSNQGMPDCWSSAFGLLATASHQSQKLSVANHLARLELVLLPGQFL